MSNVTAFPGVMVQASEPNEALIQSLEKMLDDARSGELQSLFATGCRTNGLRMSCIFPHHNVYEVVGSLELLKHEYINNWTMINE